MEKQEYGHEKAEKRLVVKRDIKQLAKKNLKQCECGEKKGLIYFRGKMICGDCLNVDFEKQTIETMARDKSMVGSSLECVQEIW